MEQIINILKPLLEPVSIVLILIILVTINFWIFKKVKSTKLNGNILKNSIATLVIFVGLLVFILSLPIDKTHKGQILSLLAIVVSAGIALSSTTVLGNLIAGIMNNSMNRFRNGDLIKIGDLQGRVTKKSIFHTEIQLEDSNFISIPNLYIATNPVKLTRKTDTVISTSVSLGYDIPRTTIEESLKEAAILTGLVDPYVYITNLGDYSVVYKIHGFLEDSSKYFSTNSFLNANVMDVLHEKKIEILSPSFMNQRRVDEMKFIPKYVAKDTEPIDKKSPEDLIFDQAIKSEIIEAKKDYLKEIDQNQIVLREKLKHLKDDKEIDKIKYTIKRNVEMTERIEKSIKEQIERDNNSIK